MTPLLRTLLIAATLWLSSTSLLIQAAESPAAAQAPTASKVTVGWVEFVQLMPSGAYTKAKLDTGAMTSSMHATHIRQFERDGRPWVSFRFKKARTAPIHGMPAVPAINVTMEAPLNRMVRIKQHTVDFVERPEVDLAFEMGGRRYTTPFTLTDRSEFIYPVLLGRRFLETAVLVDPSRMNMTGMPAPLLAPGNKK